MNNEGFYENRDAYAERIIAHGVTVKSGYETCAKPPLKIKSGIRNK